MKGGGDLYSLIETCTFLGVDPRCYVNAAIQHMLTNRGATFLPHQLVDAG